MKQFYDVTIECLIPSTKIVRVKATSQAKAELEVRQMPMLFISDSTQGEWAHDYDNLYRLKVLNKEKA